MKRILILHIVLLLALALPAQSVKELQKQQRELQQQLEQTSKMLKQTKKDETATVNKLNLLNNDIQTRKKLIRNIQGEINGLNGEMGQLRYKRSELQKELEAHKEDYAPIAVLYPIRRLTEFVLLQSIQFYYQMRVCSTKKLRHGKHPVAEFILRVLF